MARRLRRGNLDAAAAMSLNGSPAPTRLPRCARNDTPLTSLNRCRPRRPNRLVWVTFASVYINIDAALP